MRGYQPQTLNTLEPYKGPQGFGMSTGSSQTIDNVTTITKNQLDPTPFGSLPSVSPSFSYEGLSEDIEMRPRQTTGRARIPSGSSSGSSRNQQTTAARIQAIQQTIPSLPSTPGTVKGPASDVMVPTPAKPWYKSPLYLALLAAGVFFVAKKYKIV